VKAVNRELLRLEATAAASTIYDVVGRISMNWSVGRRWVSGQEMWSAIRTHVLDKDGVIQPNIARILDKAAVPETPTVGAIVAVRLGAMSWALAQGNA
jgi:hypothetical protein